MSYVLLSLCLGLAHSRARTDLTIDNFDPAEVVRYPLVIVQGAAEGPEMAIGTSWKTANRFPVVNHRYTSAVELKPGRNMLFLHSGPDTLKFRLDYKPMTNPNKVLAIYVCAADALEDPKITRDRCDVAMKTMQSLTAEAMNRAGYGRKASPLDLAQDGKISLRVVKSPKTLAELEAMDETTTRAHVSDLTLELVKQASSGWQIWLGFGNVDPATHKSRGLRTLKVAHDPGVKDVDWWPETLKDICRVNCDDLSSWDKFNAARFSYDPSMQPDGLNKPAVTLSPPTIRLEGDDVVIDAPNGLRVAGAEGDGIPSWFTEYKGADPPKNVKLSRKGLRAKMAETKLVLRILVVDDKGGHAQVDDKG